MTNFGFFILSICKKATKLLFKIDIITYPIQPDFVMKDSSCEIVVAESMLFIWRI